MKFRAKPLAYSLVLAGLVYGAINVASAAAKPGGGYIIYYYSDASYKTVVGERGLQCGTGTPFQSGQITAYPGPTIDTSCSVSPPPGNGQPPGN